MNKLFLYTVFHGNLGFSSIPKEQYSPVIDRCFWPIVDLLSQHPNIKLGFEFPSDTLEIISREDPLLIRTLADCWDKGQCELIGSGYAQTIFPLLPASANARNLAYGHEDYRRLLGKTPITAYANEQVYSSGMLKLYHDSGYENLIIDWDNISAYNPYPESYRYGTQWAVGQDGTRMTVVWNSSIAFQKFQRFAHGETSLEDYLDYLQSHYSETEDRAFLLYGSDWEIFDYRPGSHDMAYSETGTGVEVGRIDLLLSHLDKDERFELITPSEVARLFPPRKEIRLESPEYPIPCKKQEKYNVTRWAVCGRDNIKLNTQCFQLFRNITEIESLASFRHGGHPDETVDELWRELIYLWGSDFRTYTTDEKYLVFRNKMGRTLSRSEEVINQLTNLVPVDKDFALFNPSNNEWKGTPLALAVHFQPGEMKGHIQLWLDGEEIVTQEEDTETYRDGSLRKVTLVIKPFLGARSIAQGKLIARPTPKSAPDDILPGENFIETPSVKVYLSKLRGGAIKELFFPQVSEHCLVRTLPHGYFKNIKLGADFYSANMIALSRSSSEQITDLTRTELIFPPRPANFPIRIPVCCRTESPLGQLWKTFYVYRDEPRLDVEYHFRLKDFRPLSFRLGIMTINPEAFDWDTLRYSTINGGYTPETFYLKGRNVTQDEAVSLSVSTHHCLGATEGWVDISDEEKGVAVITNKSQLYSVPLVHYEEIDGTYFLRVYTSIGEADDTSEIFWRGHNRINITYLGHGKNLDKVRVESTCINSGLVIIWRKMR